VIVYTLKCEHNHHFEEWFTSSGRYEEMATAGSIVCPECSSRTIEKAPMAPALSGTSGNVPGGCMDLPDAPPCASSCNGGCMAR
jgi:Uncharacterized protein conserved in bacteria